MKVVIFAGGVGTRLWPLSRKNSPKQFGKLFGDKSTLQQTIDRLMPDFSYSDIFIATGAQYKDIVFEQLSQIPRENFIFEPAMRDVGPAIGLCAMHLVKKFPDEPVAILWSDHLVRNEDLFRKALTLAGKDVIEKKADFVFLTQTPRFASQNMGWIEIGEAKREEGEILVHEFTRLIYRPSLEEAGEFIKNKSFVWNLGYFVTTPRYLTSLFAKHVPSMHLELEEIFSGNEEDLSGRIEKKYPELEKISFDDAVLTKMNKENVLVYLSDLRWSDIGAWESLKEALAENDKQNVVRGNVVTRDSSDSLIFNDTNQLVVGLDLEGFVVINTHDVVLICPKDSVPKIKKFVETLAGTPHEHLT